MAEGQSPATYPSRRKERKALKSSACTIKQELGEPVDRRSGNAKLGSQVARVRTFIVAESEMYAKLGLAWDDTGWART